ncbi:MAG: hypothetical protein ACREIA_04275 [Opitutaceae bacterium]
MIVAFEDWVRLGDRGRFDVCVVGAGPAGIEISTSLARGRQRILVLEAGGPAYDAGVQARHAHSESGQPLLGGAFSFRAGATGPAADQVRMRVLGGTGTIWSGKWKLPDAIDFENRLWVSPARWPAGLREIEPHARAVMTDHAVPVQPLLADHLAAARGFMPGLVSVRHFEQSPPCDFAAKYREQLEQAQNLTVVTGAQVCELLPASGGAGVSAALAAGVSGERVEVGADVFVLAVGGIETARLLLASRRFGPAGAGDEHGHVGVGFMDHPKTRLGIFFPRRPSDVDFLAGSPAGRRHGLFRRISLPHADQRELEIPNHALGFLATEPMHTTLKGCARRLLGRTRPCECILFMEQTDNAASRVTLSEKLEPSDS